MNVEQFAEFWQMQGHRVVKVRGCYWYNTYPAVYMSMPYHRTLALTKGEILEIQARTQAMVLRYPETCTMPEHESGGLYVCSDRSYDLGSLERAARNRTRRALRECRVDRFSPKVLAETGYRLVVDTLVRQGRAPDSFPRHRWEAFCHAADAVEGFEVWGSFVGQELAAFCVCARVEDTYSMVYQSSSTEHLSSCPNNALVFVLIQSVLAEGESSVVSYGLKSVEDTSGLNSFKERMGFQLRPHMDQIRLNPILAAALRMGAADALMALHRRSPANDFWRKACRVVSLSSLQVQPDMV